MRLAYVLAIILSTTLVSAAIDLNNIQPPAPAPSIGGDTATTTNTQNHNNTKNQTKTPPQTTPKPQELPTTDTPTTQNNPATTAHTTQQTQETPTTTTTAPQNLGSTTTTPEQQTPSAVTQQPVQAALPQVTTPIFMIALLALLAMQFVTNTILIWQVLKQPKAPSEPQHHTNILEAKNYIAQLRAAGVSDFQIREYFKNAGWSNEQINLVLYK